MLKKGGIFLGLALWACLAYAQDKTADMFRADNPNLVNLNEPTTYTGSPLLYIQGMKAPEKAKNDMEALQLKLFGTKDVRKATKDTLTLSDDGPEIPENQIQNFTFQTPFHQTVQAAFIHHIPDFTTLIQLQDQNLLMITETLTVMNTEEGTLWKREIELPSSATAQVINYTQNGHRISIKSRDQENHFIFESPIPMEIGPNKLSLQYRIYNPFQKNGLELDLTGYQLNWPIERFRALVLTPFPLEYQQNKLVFGRNQMDIPNAYISNIDTQSNVNFAIQGIVPPKANIHLQLNFDPTKLPVPEKSTTSLWFMIGVITILFFYWLTTVLWEAKLVKKIHLQTIKYPRTILQLAHQINTQMTDQKWAFLLNFAQNNNLPNFSLKQEQEAWQKSPHQIMRKTKFITFFKLTGELIIGTIILTVLSIIALTIFDQTLSCMGFVALVIFTMLGILCSYYFGLKPIRKQYWQTRLNIFMQPNIIAGLTQKQATDLTPLFIITQKYEDWRQNLIKINPKIAQNIHLT